MLNAAAIGCGLAGFVLMFAFDWLTATKPDSARSMVGLAGFVMLAASTAIMFVTTADRSRLLSASGIAFLALGMVFFSLLVFSLFIELPKETYGGKDPKHLVVDTGTWALCRHPGVLWFAFGYGCAALASGSKAFALAATVWTAADILYVILQERMIFRKIFTDYDRYVASTPFLLPSRASISRCFSTLRRNPGHGEKTGD